MDGPTRFTASALRRANARSRFAIVVASAFAIATAGCAQHHLAPVTNLSWALGGSEPPFDPEGPPDVRRWALERLLTRGLVDEERDGAIVPAAAESILVSDDSLTWTFRLKSGLVFSDGTPCRSADFARELTGGLGRADHATRSWTLAAVRGVDAVRVGKPLPALGIETPDDRTLVLRLVRQDRLLLRKLAMPGVSDAWSTGSGATWKGARGLGPFRVAAADSGRRMWLVPVGKPQTFGAWVEPETTLIRFGLTPARVRALQRNHAVDLVWPLPVGMLDQALPDGFRSATAPARPRRLMLLVMRADLPPTSKLAARQALAHGINRDDVVRLLGQDADRRTSWIVGAGPADFPTLDGGQIQLWMDRGKLGRSFHVDLAFRGDGEGASIARTMQGDWSRYSIYIEPTPMRGERWTEEALNGSTHLLLVESQAPLDDVSAELAQLVMPLRGPAVGTWRSGWRTREFDAAIGWKAAVAPPDPEVIAQRLEQELVALPLAELPWAWIQREGTPDVPVHPHFGPECLIPVPAKAP